MIFSQLIAASCLVSAILADPAPVSRDSPEGSVYSATFVTGNIKGVVSFGSISGFAVVNARVSGLPATGGPFDYAIHQRRVQREGLCRGTLGIFDPYDGEPDAPTEAEFRVGDLSGKHGQIKTRSIYSVYLDPYLSLNPPNEAFVGDLSLVIRNNAGTRIACVNIEDDAMQKNLPKDVMEEAQRQLDEFKKNNPGMD